MQESEISNVEETSCLLNNDSPSIFEKNSVYIEDYNVDTRTELKFDIASENDEEKAKRHQIEDALLNKNTNTLSVWQTLAIGDHGLVGDDLRRKIWPLLLGVDPSPDEKTPSLEDLSSHVEYDQVILDVNRSIKRFPPGIPLKQRLALQNQLTVLILRVIIKYPHLRYYQGYHDVAITFLLVVGEAVAFRIMERLSTDHLKECMEPTMEKTSYTMNYVYAILQKVDRPVHDFMDRAMVGTMFALPWYLTWFGHSLNQYKDVVRLYDYFLASPKLMSLYVAASLVVERRDEVFQAGCDMAMIHVTLSKIPDRLDFEAILKRASVFYKKYPPTKLERAVKRRVQNENYQRNHHGNSPMWVRLTQGIPPWLVFHNKGRYGLLFVTATVLIGMYAYYLKTTDSKFSFFGMFNT